MSNKAFKVYQQTSVNTAKPDKILLMLYEGCLKFIRIAKLKLHEKKIAEKGKNISKALAIISELINTLDHEIGGQLSKDLESLYMFMMDKLIAANLNNSVEDLETVEKLMSTLFEAWTDVITNPRPDGVPSAKLQPELYSMYVTSQPHSQTTNLKQNPSMLSGVSINLSKEK